VRLRQITMDLAARERVKQLRYFVWALAKGRGDLVASLAAAESARFDGSAPDALRVLKAAVAAGTTTSPGWAQELAGYYSLTSEWVRSTTDASLLGALPYTRVPFQTRTLIEGTPAVATFIDEGAPIPMSRFSLSNTATLARAKCAALIAVTSETMEIAKPANLESMDDALRRAVVRGIDHAMLDPDVAASGSIPASLLHGVNAIPSTGNSAAAVEADIANLVGAHTVTGADPARLAIAGHPDLFLSMSKLRNNGQRVFPDIGVAGGEIMGVPAYASIGCIRATGSPNEKFLACLAGDRILVADDGLAVFSASDQAAVQMVDAPVNGAASVVSMFQTHSTAVKCVRYINFQRAADNAVSWLVPQV
jgi:hypothetical protein